MPKNLLRVVPIVIVLLLYAAVAGPEWLRNRMLDKELAPQYAALCEGAPLKTVERRNQAMEDGYVVNKLHDCIEKASFKQVAEAKAKYQAEHTPAAQAEAVRVEAARIAQAAREKETAELQAIAAQLQTPKPPTDEPPQIPFRRLDANTAAEADLANAFGLDAQIAADMVHERGKKKFTDWPDLINRVTAFGAARTAMFATLGGLNVNGLALPGPPPDASMVALARESLRPRP
ncbi:hypothetical protein [Massilia sp. CF038]|uniref:hypothetical protein n=1 Tax=Massilia sp. CF038 TaxID=1881045 RepID=UPI000910D579|nr:hypothetical protein [Massilia sp. CF038]SHH57546.1 hypothetical protein SAMN05428948_4540 [Massilia sp. CF038]